MLARPIDARPDFRPGAWLDELLPLDAFGTLVFQVAGQQLSVSSTRAIINHLQERFGGHMPSPAELPAADPQVLRDSLSARKGETLRALAARFVDGRLSDKALSRMTDDEVEATLTEVPGVCSIAALTGFAVGWRPERGLLLALAGFGVFLLFSYAMSWACACLAIVGKSPESAGGTGIVILFPLAFVSNALRPTQRMPTVLQTIADWSPVSAVTAAARELFGNPNPSASIDAWPMHHPVTASLLWSVALIAIFAPLATMLYRRRTAD